MKTIISLTLIVTSALSISCSYTPERKVATPQGSESSLIPWNTPGADEGQGALGGSLSR